MQGEVSATDQRFLRGLGRVGQTLGLQLREQEAVDVIAHAVGRGDLRRDGRGDRLEGPVLAWVGDFGLARRWPGQALADPLGERGDFLRREFLVLARHRFDVLVLGVVDREDEAAPLRLPRDDDRPDFASFEDERFRVQAQTRLLFLGSVAVFDQDRAHLFFEELELGGRRGRVSPGQTPGQGEARQQQDGRGFHRESNKNTLGLFLQCQTGVKTGQEGVREGFFGLDWVFPSNL